MFLETKICQFDICQPIHYKRHKFNVPKSQAFVDLVILMSVTWLIIVFFHRLFTFLFASVLLMLLYIFLDMYINFIAHVL